MTQVDISALIASARDADEPAITPKSGVGLGGVDPLGLRQVNFDMMDQVLPGINNVGRHVRPFVVTAWACRRAVALAEAADLELVDVRDFVDRIEVIYAWSQFATRSDADLPGRQTLEKIARGPSYTFGGPEWQKLRKDRRYSTAFTAPVTYGPAMKNLGWVGPYKKQPEALIALPEVFPALDAFEAEIAAFLEHPAFSTLKPVTVHREEVLDWAAAWDLMEPTEVEQRIFAERLWGAAARRERRDGLALALEAARHVGEAAPEVVRKALCAPPGDFVAPEPLAHAAVAWRRLQVRQLFRYSLEGVFHWIGGKLEGGPKTTDNLVNAFLEEVGKDASSGGAWRAALLVSGAGPTDYMDEIETGLWSEDPADMARPLAAGLVYALGEAPANGEPFERSDRLPVWRARREADQLDEQPAAVLARRVLEGWVLAQHHYWSVGRGLADARSDQRQILRLKIVMEEQGWELAAGANPPGIPYPTPDRLVTALTLAGECGGLGELEETN